MFISCSFDIVLLRISCYGLGGAILAPTKQLGANYWAGTALLMVISLSCHDFTIRDFFLDFIRRNTCCQLNGISYWNGEKAVFYCLLLKT